MGKDGEIPRSGCRRTLIQPTPPLIPKRIPRHRPHPPLPLLLVVRNMHATLNRDVRIRNTRRQQFPNRPQKKHVPRGRFSPLLQHVSQLLEDGVLQYRIDDENESGQDAGEKRLGAFGAEEFEKGAEGGWFGALA